MSRLAPILSLVACIVVIVPIWLGVLAGMGLLKRLRNGASLSLRQYGVLFFGFPMFFANLLAPYISHSLFKQTFAPWSAIKVFTELLIWLGVGVWYGFVTHRLQEPWCAHNSAR